MSTNALLESYDKTADFYISLGFIDMFCDDDGEIILPDEPPYGFWIAPDGDFMVIADSHSHLQSGKMVRAFLKDYRSAGEKGYLRVVKDNNDHKYKCDIPGFGYKTATPRQRSTANDLASFYNLEAEFVDGSHDF